MNGKIFDSDCTEKNFSNLNINDDISNKIEIVTDSTSTDGTTTNVVSASANQIRKRKIDAQYYQSHKAKISKKCKSYYKTHKTKILEKKKYYEADQGKLKDLLSNSKEKAYDLHENKCLENSDNYYKQNKKQICSMKGKKLYYDLKKKYCDLSKEQILM